MLQKLLDALNLRMCLSRTILLAPFLESLSLGRTAGKENLGLTRTCVKLSVLLDVP